MYTQRLRWDIDDARAVLMAASEAARQQAYQGASADYLAGYLCALRLVACGFGFQVADAGSDCPAGGTIDRALVCTHVG